MFTTQSNRWGTRGQLVGGRVEGQVAPKFKSPTRKDGVWGTLYDVVGSVKRHEELASGGLVFLLT